MKIKSIIEREEGHAVELGDTLYEFMPPGFTVEVTDKHHLATLLAIPEGYEVVMEEGAAAKKPKQVEPATAPAQTILNGSDVHPSAFEIHGVEYTLGAIVQAAFATSGLTGEAWNALDEGERADLIDAELDKLNNNPPTTNPPASKFVDREELEARYVAKFGKKPHHKAGIDKILAELEAP